jgi:hypothetical protein
MSYGVTEEELNKAKTVAEKDIIKDAEDSRK